MKPEEPQKYWHCNRCGKDVANIDERCDCTESPVPLTQINPPPPQKQCPCSFGSINIETGEFCDGRVDKKGNMTFHHNFWESLKNAIRFWLFGNPYKPKPVFIRPKIEVIGEIDITRTNRWTGVERNAGTVGIYRKFDPDTNQSIRIWSKNIYGIRSFGDDEYDLDIYDQTGRLEKI